MLLECPNDANQNPVVACSYRRVCTHAYLRTHIAERLHQNGPTPCQTNPSNLLSSLKGRYINAYAQMLAPSDKDLEPTSKAYRNLLSPIHFYTSVAKSLVAALLLGYAE